MKLKLILNPVAGGGKAERICPQVQKFLEERRISFDMERTSARGDGIAITKKAIASGFDTIVAVGGDGTATEIVNGIAESQATLGMIPCGEGNDFPKMLGLSGKNIKEACGVIAEGFTKRIDLGMVNGKYFLNMLGIGFDGEIAANKDMAPKFLHGFSVYLYAFIKVLLTFKPKKVRLKFNGASIETSMLLAGIGNGRCTANTLWLTPNAEIDDGLLDICLVKFAGRLRTMWDLQKVPRKEIMRLSYATTVRARELILSSDTPLFAHLDGEVIKEKEFNVKILPKKLKVLARKDI
jgi:YegS/Rv2252/BmrU family lipid kinase